MNSREQKVFDAISKDDRVHVAAEVSGGRVIVDIPTALIQTHEDFTALRGKDPAIDLLTQSVKSSGGDSLYSVSLYCELSEEGLPIYYCGDGHQRLRALLANGIERTFAQVILRWRDARDAAEESLAANTVRYAVTDADLYSIVRHGKIPREKIKSLTGFSDSKLDRIYAVAPHAWLCEWVDSGCVSQAEAAKWVIGCKKSDEKLAAIQNSIQPLVDKAEEVAEHYRRTAKRTPLKGEDRKKVKTGYIFKMQHAKQSQQLVDASHAEEIERNESGIWHVKEDVSAAVPSDADVIIGPATEWESNLALSNFFGRTAEDIPAASYAEVLANWENIGIWVRRHAEKKGLRIDGPVVAPTILVAKADEPASRPQTQEPVATIDATEGDA